MSKEQQKKLIVEIMNDDAKDGMYDQNNMTAVEWLFEKINMFCLFTDGIPDEWSEALEQAKEIEKKQIVDAYRFGHIFHDTNDFDSAEQYYEDEYGK